MQGRAVLAVGLAARNVAAKSLQKLHSALAAHALATKYMVDHRLEGVRGSGREKEGSFQQTALLQASLS